MAERRIDVEVTISGIGLLDVAEKLVEPAQGCRGPARARGVSVLFPKPQQHHRHEPRFTYFAEDDLRLEPGTELGISPDGREIVSRPLAGKRLFIRPPYPYDQHNPESALLWSSPTPSGDPPEVPATPHEDRCLDWLLDADEIGLGEVVDDEVGTVVHFPEGQLFARNVFRNRQSPDLLPVRWRIGAEGRVQAIAREIVFRMEGLWRAPSFWIADKSGDKEHDAQAASEEIQLLPGGDNLLRVAISNHPVRYFGEESHLGVLAAMTAVDGAEISLPEQSADDVRTIGSACDVPYRIH